MKNDLLQRGPQGDKTEASDFPETIDLDKWILYNLRHYLCRPGNSDMYEDCLQEARLSLWNARRKISTLSEEARRAYMAICIRHAAKRLLRRELSVYSRLSPLSDVSEEAGDDSSSAVNSLTPKRWLSSLNNADLQRELLALPERDIEVLYLYYTCQLTDSEVAQTLYCSVAAVQQKRRRILIRLRLRLQQTRIHSSLSVSETT